MLKVKIRETREGMKDIIEADSKMKQQQKVLSEKLSLIRKNLDERLPNSFQIERGMGSGLEKSLKLFLKNQDIKFDTDIELLRWASEKNTRAS